MRVAWSLSSIVRRVEVFQKLKLRQCYIASVKDVGHTVCSWKLRPLTKWRRFLLPWGDAILVGESGVRPFFGSVVPPSALGETWSAASHARKVLMARENPWERRRGRRGVKQVLGDDVLICGRE
eukprot:scaffold239_cov382-Pavlova_lutheri.AAC.17